MCNISDTKILYRGEVKISAYCGSGTQTKYRLLNFRPPLAVDRTQPASEPVSRLKGGAKWTLESVTELNHYFLIVSQVIRRVSVPPVIIIGAPGGVGHHLLLCQVWGSINKLSKPLDP